jgi:hypothetical protein
VIFNSGFDPLGTGTVQGIKDSAVFFSGVVGGAVAATVGKDDQVNANYGIGSAAGSNAADNNALAYVARMPDILAKLASGGWQALTAEALVALRWCASNPTCSTGLPTAVIGYLATQRMATAPSAADQIPTGYPNAPPPTGGTPPSLVSTDNQPNNTGNQNPVTTGGSNNTGGDQIINPVGSTIVGGGFGSGAQPAVGNGIVMSTGVTNSEIPKLDIPSTPAGMTPNQFGKDVIGWGSAPDASLARANSVTTTDVAVMIDKGLTKDMAIKWRDFYANDFARNSNNATAANRVKLMNNILNKWP